MKIWKDFKEFAFKGNVMDMAIGVIIGGAFGKIVASVVENIITPLISLLTGNTSFNDLMWVLKDGTLDSETGEMVKQKREQRAERAARRALNHARRAAAVDGVQQQLDENTGEKRKQQIEPAAAEHRRKAG